MSACCRDGIDYFRPKLVGEVLELLFRQRSQVAHRTEGIQKRSGGFLGQKRLGAAALVGRPGRKSNIRKRG
jgi:hypothetical protein